MNKAVLILGVLMMTMIINTAVTNADDNIAFNDVTANYRYAKGINYCVSNGIIRRTAPSEFSPNEPLGRELLACILYRMENSPSTDSKITFDDVEKGRWFQTGVIWAAQNNILVGYGDGRFGVNDKVTKEQLASALWRYAEKPSVGAELNCTDAVLVSPWAVEPVSWAIKNSILDADNGIFEPQAPVSRAMAAEAIMNFLKIKETPYIKSLSENISEDLPQGKFTEKISIKIKDSDDEAIVSLTDSKPTREFIAQLPMNVTFSDFGNREKFGRIPVPISEDEALLSGYEIGDFSYGTAYD